LVGSGDCGEATTDPTGQEWTEETGSEQQQRREKGPHDRVKQHGSREGGSVDQTRKCDHVSPVAGDIEPARDEGAEQVRGGDARTVTEGPRQMSNGGTG
jgi:hypothetical protein